MEEGIWAPAEDEPWLVELHQRSQYSEAPERTEEVSSGGPSGGAALPVLREALDFRYPHQAACSVPTKLTATQLKGREKDKEIAEETVQPYVRRDFAAPRFLSGHRPLTGAERGTAMHLVMQYLPLEEDTDVEEVVTSLTARRLLTEEQAEAVDREAVRRFLASPLAAELRQADRVEREYRFSLLIPGSDYFAGLEDGEEILLQGVADLFAVKNGRVTIIDFKTDYVTEETLMDKAEGYRSQLETYSAALEKILELPVVRKALYFFRLGQAVEM